MEHEGYKCIRAISIEWTRAYLLILRQPYSVLVRAPVRGSIERSRKKYFTS